MNINPGQNVIVFLVDINGTDEKLVGEAPTRDKDGVRQVWETLRQERDLQPEQVKQMYSEWELSDEDKAFVEATFAANDLKVSFSFHRPQSEDGWDEALQKAGEAIRNSAKQQEKQQAEPTLMPILRSLDGPKDQFAEIVVNVPIAEELGLFLANVARTPHDTFGMDYLMKNSDRAKETHPRELFGEAFQNYVNGLNIKGFTNNEESYLLVQHELDIGTSALGLPDFFQNACEWTKAKEIFVAIIDPGKLLVTDLNNKGTTEQFEELALTSDYWGAVYLTPSCYKLTADGLELLCKRQAKEESGETDS